MPDSIILLFAAFGTPFLALRNFHSHNRKISLISFTAATVTWMRQPINWRNYLPK